jgi:[ribosomal protein S5]-alanine N-acetyltransferase
MEFKLRPFKETDLKSLVKYANNPKVASNLTDRFPHPYTEEAGRSFIAMAMSHQPTQIMTIDIDGEASGGIGLHPGEDVYRMNAELGYWVAEPYWGHGIATRAVKQMIEYGFKHLPITRIYARPFSPNIASQKVLEKAGMKKEAVLKNAFFKNGQYCDEIIYSISIV